MSITRKLARTSLLAGVAAIALAIGAPQNTNLPASQLQLVSTAEAQARVNVGIFFDRLAPHGRWVRHRAHGWVFVPVGVGRNWRPYTNGRWVYTNACGWFWVSEEPFGWATYRYGRWGYSRASGWYWVPGNVWGCAWVTWRVGPDYVGWAPLAPDRRGFAWGTPTRFRPAVAESWVFVETRFVTAPTIVEHVVPIIEIPIVLAQATQRVDIQVEQNIAINQVLDVTQINEIAVEPVQQVEITMVEDPDQATVTDDQGVGTINNDDAPPTLSIADASVREGNKGRTPLDLIVTLSGSITDAVTVNYATANGTALLSDLDYQATSGTLFFAAADPGDPINSPGDTQQTITVFVIGDVKVEPDETFFVNVTNVTGATVSDGQGQGTIVNDDTNFCALEYTPIYQIQGSGASAAITGNVTTQGVVVGDFEGTASASGFYLQDLTGDGDAATSDGIFVFTGSANLVSAGQVVRVTGYARERFDQTTLNGSNSNSSAVPAANIVNCGTGSVTPIDVMMPFASLTEPERFEGMLVARVIPESGEGEGSHSNDGQFRHLAPPLSNLGMSERRCRDWQSNLRVALAMNRRNCPYVYFSDTNGSLRDKRNIAPIRLRSVDGLAGARSAASIATISPRAFTGPRRCAGTRPTSWDAATATAMAR